MGGLMLTLGGVWVGQGGREGGQVCEVGKREGGMEHAKMDRGRELGRRSGI